MATRSKSVSVRWAALVAGAFLAPACGGDSRLEFYTHEPGNFRVLAAGKPELSQKSVASPAGQLSMSSVESVDKDQVRRVVVYTDFPRPMVESNDPDALLDGGVRGMSGKREWSVESQGPITLDGHPGREVRFAVTSTGASEKGSGRARVFLIGNRLYQTIMVGPTSKVSEEDLDQFVKSFELVKKVPVVASTAGEGTPEPSAAAEPASPSSAGPTVATDGESAPTQTGQPAPAAGAAVTANDEPTQPEPDDPASSASPNVAAQQNPPRSAQALRSDPNRRPVGRPARVATRASAAAQDRTAQTEDVGPDPAKPAEKPIHVTKTAARLSEQPMPNGNPQDRFREVAPKHGVLVGMRVGYANAFGGSKVGSIQPIFQVDSTYGEGQQYGGNMAPALTVMARPGYAVGAINTRTGLLLDGFQIIFARYKSGRLDTKDSYKSEWIGDPRGGGSANVSGAGNIVVGIHGRSNGREINALGLVVAE